MELKAQNLEVGYGEKTIVKDMNLTVPVGKISVILGANGCGKSTLLKSFSKLLKPKSGIVTLDSHSIEDFEPKNFAQYLSLLPQSPTVPAGISVYDLVSRGRYPYSKMFGTLTQEDHEKIEEALKLMNVYELKDERVDSLSGGQRQRVWIALALAQDTNVLLLDEPTTYLDISYQIELLDALMKINKLKRTTIVMVLHDINLSARYADCIFALKKGQLINAGVPSEIITSELMKEVYDLDCDVINDPVSNTPLIISKGIYHK